MNIVTDHATWCVVCGKYLSASNPGAALLGRVVCLACLDRLRLALIAQAAEDEARER